MTGKNLKAWESIFINKFNVSLRAANKTGRRRVIGNWSIAGLLFEKICKRRHGYLLKKVKKMKRNNDRQGSAG